MDTLVISYRVVDFLKKYPPFQAMDEADLWDWRPAGASAFTNRTNTSSGKGNLTGSTCS